MIMSLETNTIEFAEKFLAAQDLINKIGYEIIGTKDINDEIHYIVKKKK